MKPLSIPSYLLEPDTNERIDTEHSGALGVRPEELSSEIRSSLEATLQTSVDNPHFFEDLQYFMEYALKLADEEGDGMPTPETMEEEFSYMRPVRVIMRDTFGDEDKEYRCYSLNDIGAGGYKDVQLRLYIADETYHVAADASIQPGRVHEVTETLGGDMVTPLTHEMNMYKHLAKLLSVHPFMAKYFLKFYGCAVNTETGQSSMSLELATGFDGHTDLSSILDNIRALEDFLTKDNDFGEDQSEAVKNHLIYYQRNALRFFVDGIIAIRFLHENNVFCSDIKPENFFLHTEDSTSYAKLGDFGAAMFIGHDTLHLMQTQATPGYYDVDMIHDIFDGTMDPRQADLYALRCCIDELWDAKILSLDIYERIIALPWDDMYELEYAENVLPALQTLLILQ